VEAARKNRVKQFVIDGEAVILGVDGISDFNALHSGKHNDEVQHCAFDILVDGDNDLRRLPLQLRKNSLERLLARRPEGIFVNPFEQGEIGADLPCRMRYGAGGSGLQAPRPAIPERQVEILGEGQEPEASGDEQGDGGAGTAQVPPPAPAITNFSSSSKACSLEIC
jgi:bifunctional non-homologous end joining protein LigD